MIKLLCSFTSKDICDILKNVFKGNTTKYEIIKTLNRLVYEQDKIAQEFYKMLEEKEYEK